MGTIQLPPDFKEFLKLLNSRKVEYLLIGGYSVGYHGYPRPTGDLDIWISKTPDNAERALEVLQEFGFSCPVELLQEDNQLVRMGISPFRIEILTTIDGVSFADCYAERVRGELDGVEVNVISLPKLRENKKASARSKDIMDLENLPE
jgi:predicted nucleotidyltransferase